MCIRDRPKELFSRPKELLDWLCDRKVTSLTWAVSALCLISTFHGLDYRVPETVRRVLFSGEVMPEKHLRAWRTHLPEAVFVNLYGPTETVSYTHLSASNSMSWRERVGWVTWSTSAAAEMLSAWATVRKYRSTRSSMGPPPFLALDLV